MLRLTLGFKRESRVARPAYHGRGAPNFEEAAQFSLSLKLSKTSLESEATVP